MGSVQPGVPYVNKFGYCTDADSAAETDIHDGANATDLVKTWVKPTAARIHAIVSTSADDTNGGIGCHKVRVYGLQTWDDEESYEEVTMAGLTPVNTVNSYVIIHRIKCFLYGGTNGPNAGVITATAATDGTVTAQVNAQEGQTQMAIYGIPRGTSAHVTRYYGSVIKAAAGVGATVRLRVNEIPETSIGFITKHIMNASSGSAPSDHDMQGNPIIIRGPAIIKITVNPTAINTAAAGGFDADLVK